MRALEKSPEGEEMKPEEKEISAGVCGCCTVGCFIWSVREIRAGGSRHRTVCWPLTPKGNTRTHLIAAQLTEASLPWIP